MAQDFYFSPPSLWFLNLAFWLAIKAGGVPTDLIGATSLTGADLRLKAWMPRGLTDGTNVMIFYQ
jgi:hypothetical protein